MCIKSTLCFESFCYNHVTNLFIKNYTSRIKNNIKTIKRLPKIKGVKEIMYPGQNKDKRFRMNLKKEIKLSKIIQKDLVDLNN